MMTITTRHVKYVDDIHMYYWKIAGVKPIIDNYETIIKIEVDGEELTYVLTNFTGIPKRIRGALTTFNSPIVWKAPFAQFIYDNMNDLFT